MLSLPDRSILLPILGAVAAACSGGGSSDPKADAGTFDADTTQPDGMPAAVECATVANFTDLAMINGDVVVDAENEYLSIDSTLDVGPPPDLFVVELFGGFGVMTDGLKTGTFEITGDETDFNLCGVCVSVIADFEAGVGSPMTYVAQSGTVTITSIEGNFTGSFAPAGGTTTMIGATINEDTGDFDPRSDCTITGGGATWDKAIPGAPAP